MFNIFFPKIVPFIKYVKNFGVPRGAINCHNMAHTRCMLDKKGYTSRARMQPSTRPNTHTHTNALCLLLFNSNNCLVNAAQCYVLVHCLSCSSFVSFDRFFKCLRFPSNTCSAARKNRVSCFDTCFVKANYKATDKQLNTVCIKPTFTYATWLLSDFDKRCEAKSMDDGTISLIESLVFTRFPITRGVTRTLLPPYIRTYSIMAISTNRSSKPVP